MKELIKVLELECKEFKISNERVSADNKILGEENENMRIKLDEMSGLESSIESYKAKQTNFE